MKKIILITVLLVMLSFMFAEKLVVENPYKPKVKATKLKLANSYEIHEDFDMANMFFIQDDKIITVSMAGKMAILTDLEGNLVDLIDELGSGPGELQMPAAIYDDGPNNRFGITDQINRRNSYYDYDGNYIEDIAFQGMDVEQSLYYCGDTKIRYYFKIIINQEKGTVMMEPTVEIQAESGPVKVFTSLMNPLQMDFSTGAMPWVATSDEYVYVTTMNFKEYRVQVFNPDGTHKMDIVKEFKKLKRPKEELEKIEDMMDGIKEQTRAAGGQQEIDTAGFQYENGVNSMITDAQGQLWVHSFDDKGAVFDIYNETGKIVSQARIEDHRFGQCQFYKGKLYEITTDEEDDELYILNIYKVK